MKNKKIVLDLIIVILFISLVVAIYYFYKNRNVYYDVETKMIEKAKEFVSKNNMEVTNQNYIFIDDLNISNVELCSKSSGVIATKVNDDIRYTPYLKCADYESKIINNDSRYIKINGGDVVFAPLGSLYLDDGYTKLKDVDVTTMGNVLDEIGAYTINYVVKENGEQKQILKRIIIVSEYDANPLNVDDEGNPVIVLTGDEDMTITINQKFEEPGFVAYDDKDGNLTSKVKVDSKVDTTKIGEYDIKYTVTNSKNKTASVNRVVKVVAKKSDLKITTNNKIDEDKLIIEINVSGHGFKKIILPDGTESLFATNSYVAEKNDKYIFKIIDEYNNEIIKIVTINNMDSVSPTGKCVATKGEKAYLIKVNATDNVGIKGIIYVINGKESGLFNSYEYKTAEILEKAEAIIVDLSGNKAKVTCDIND